MATLYYGQHVHIAQTRTSIPTSYICVGQESESESILESIFGNVNEPLGHIYATFTPPENERKSDIAVLILLGISTDFFEQSLCVLS